MCALHVEVISPPPQEVIIPKSNVLPSPECLWNAQLHELWPENFIVLPPTR